MYVGELLNKLKWTGKLNSCKITILHRGAKGNRKAIDGKEITEVKKGYFIYKEEREIIIPMHRVLEVKLKNKTLWKKN